MDETTQKTTESAIRKVVMGAIMIFSYVWFMRKGVHPDSGLMNIITEAVLPSLLAPAALVVDTFRSYMIHKKEEFEKKVALQLPAGTNNSQLNAVVAKVAEAKKYFDDPLSSLVNKASEGIVK